jgi:cyclophilin family peptidyl-prolyl cis-trans isomerase
MLRTTYCIPVSLIALALAGAKPSCAAGIVATPASLTFPVVNIGSKAAAKVVTFKNTGSTAVTSLSITLAGGAATSAYSKSQTCGTTLAAGASCTVSVAFDPKTSGDLPVALRVTGSGSKSASVPINGLCTDVTAHAPDGNVYAFDTTQGNIYVALRPDAAPKNVANFLHYVDNGTYAHSIIHRVVAGFVNQGGGYKLNSAGQIIAPPTVAAVVNEFKLSNIRGTLAMAKLGNNPNSATDQFFFNAVNNSFLNTENGGFTVIGQIVGVQGVAGASQSAGLAVMDAINADKVYNAGSPFDSIPLLNYNPKATVKPANFVYVNAVTQVKPKTGVPATPVFSIKAGTYKGPQSISLKDSTPGATIYYYLFGPNAHNAVKYTGPFTVSSSRNVVAYAVASGYPKPSYLNYEDFDITK